MLRWELRLGMLLLLLLRRSVGGTRRLMLGGRGRNCARRRVLPAREFADSAAALGSRARDGLLRVELLPGFLRRRRPSERLKDWPGALSFWGSRDRRPAFPLATRAGRVSGERRGSEESSSEGEGGAGRGGEGREREGMARVDR